MFEQRYPHLMQPLRLRGLTVRNRIMSAPNMLFQTIGGRTTEYYTRYLEAKARGGAGIVTLGEVPVCDGGCHTPGTVMSRENLAIFSEMSAAIREHGAVSSVELTHGGRNARHEFNVRNPMGPDETESMYGHVNAMTKQDMEDAGQGQNNDGRAPEEAFACFRRDLRGFPADHAADQLRQSRRQQQAHAENILSAGEDPAGDVIGRDQHGGEPYGPK